MVDVGDRIAVSDSFQTGYSYMISHPYGKVASDLFEPYFTPKEMLDLGVFEGKYINDCQDEFPASWFANAKLSEAADPTKNYFGVKSRQSLKVWRSKGWTIDPDPRGWFQWYCRYFMGRRLAAIDDFQIRRWRGLARHAAQVSKNCAKGNVFCRPRQRQTLLQWGYDPLI